MKNIAVNINTEKDKDLKILNKIMNIIKSAIPDCSISVFSDCCNLNEITLKGIDVIISLGGDGTILNTSRKVCKSGVPIFGVNIGHLGFLTSAEISDFENGIRQLECGNYLIEERSMLKCEAAIEGEIKSFYCLNDIVISKGTLSRIIECNILIDNNYFNKYNGDGVLVSTPTGSTAYSLSCGGPIIYPTLNAFSLSPICPHSLNSRSIVLDGKSNILIDVKSKKGKICLIMDGQESYEFSEEICVSITSSPYKCKIIRLKNNNYFDILREKILFRT